MSSLISIISDSVIVSFFSFSLLLVFLSCLQKQVHLYITLFTRENTFEVLNNTLMFQTFLSVVDLYIILHGEVKSQILTSCSNLRPNFFHH